MFVRERFQLNQYTKDLIHDMEPDFGYDGYGEFVFYRTYSRNINGHQENWADCVIRDIEGIMSIRKDWYIKNYIFWNEKFWQGYAQKMATSMFKMEWMPAGRGLWAMGTEFLYERGSMCAQNCGYSEIGQSFWADLGWMMDALMLGVGVGFSPTRQDDLTFKSINPQMYDFVIPDSREGWVEATSRLLEALHSGLPRPRLIYDEIRLEGEPIKGFGGIASGPEPLMEMHEIFYALVEQYMNDSYYDSVMFKTDCANLIGKTVVAGNVRRSAELASLSINDPVFKDLKNYEDPRFAYRTTWGWMSNNSVDLEFDSDFEQLGDIAERVKVRGEPGYKNLQNFPLGRIGKEVPVRLDKARGLNPCGESLLENKELCNQAESLPTRCQSNEDWIQACEYATLYASTVSLLPTHQPVTNAVINRNRRITIGIIDQSGWVMKCGVNQITKWMRKGYDEVTRINQWANGEAGVPESIRKTTIKPGGTTPKLAGRTPGIGHPTFKHTLRRTVVAKNSPLVPLLVEAEIPYEDSVTDKYSYVFEYPIIQGPAVPAEEVSLWEQAMNLVLMQREWADNSLSNTLYFKPKWLLIHHLFDQKQAKAIIYELITDYEEYFQVMGKLTIDEPDFEINNHRYKQGWDEHDNYQCQIYAYNPHHEEDHIEPVLSAIAPLTKTVSLLPHSPKGVYAQMPEEGISEEEYHRRKAAIKKIDWTKLSNSDGQDERYCQGASCEVPLPRAISGVNSQE